MLAFVLVALTSNRRIDLVLARHYTTLVIISQPSGLAYLFYKLGYKQRTNKQIQARSQASQGRFSGCPATDRQLLLY
jgi:hypothetical protein